jgi:hypothetical protein
MRSITIKYTKGEWVWLTDKEFRERPTLTEGKDVPEEIVIRSPIAFDGIEGRILTLEGQVNILLTNCGPKCSAAWPDKEHGPCRGTGMFAQIVKI